MFYRLYASLIEQDRYQLILRGLGNTLVIAFFAALIGLAIGFAAAVVKVWKNNSKQAKLLKIFADIYITVIRGTPAVVQIMIMYYIIFASVSVDKLLVAILSFGINSGAYAAEIIRAGIESIDKGQSEAGKSLGFSNTKTMIYIILPQAVKNILPAMFNEFITLLKETSIAGFIGFMDLTRSGDLIRSATFDAFTPLLIVAAIYLVLVIGLTAVMKKVERRLAHGQAG